MMKKLVLISLICVVSAVTMPVSADLISDADSAYVNDQFDRAVELYNRAVDSLGGSSERYYNLGNAYFRSGHPGMAIVSYERALRLDPTDSDVRDNLEFVNSRITDRIDAGDSFINNSVDSIAVSLHPDTWGVIALVTFLLMLAGVLVYFMASGIMLRKVGFFGAGILLIVTVVANFLATGQPAMSRPPIAPLSYSRRSFFPPHRVSRRTVPRKRFCFMREPKYISLTRYPIPPTVPAKSSGTT